MMYTTISLSITDHVAHVEFCRPDKMNALNSNMFSELIDAIKQIKSDSSIHLFTPR